MLGAGFLGSISVCHAGPYARNGPEMSPSDPSANSISPICCFFGVDSLVLQQVT